MIKVNKITDIPMWAIVVKIMFKVLTTLILLIIIPLIIINLVFVFKQDNMMPSFMGYSMLNVISGSMKDSINVGDMIIIKQTDEIAEQDIISFIEGSTLITHRVIKIEEENGKKEYTTKGDANNTEDRNKVVFEQIQGKVIFHIKGMGSVSLFLQKPQGFLILASIPILAIGITKFFEVRLADRRAIRKQERIDYMEKNR